MSIPWISIIGAGSLYKPRLAPELHSSGLVRLNPTPSEQKNQVTRSPQYLSDPLVKVCYKCGIFGRGHVGGGSLH